jgi:hypothetical protein
MTVCTCDTTKKGHTKNSWPYTHTHTHTHTDVYTHSERQTDRQTSHHNFDRQPVVSVLDLGM